MYLKKRKESKIRKHPNWRRQIHQRLRSDNTYKYLGIKNNATIEHKKQIKDIKRICKYIKRVNKICKIQLTSKNKITAINQFAITVVVTYGFLIIDWPQRGFNKLNKKIYIE